MLHTTCSAFETIGKELITSYFESSNTFIRVLPEKIGSLWILFQIPILTNIEHCRETVKMMFFKTTDMCLYEPESVPRDV